MQTTTLVAGGSFLIVVAVIAVAALGVESLDLKLVLTALSACIAAYSAWAFTWRRADVRPIPLVPASLASDRKRLLTLHNLGALPTCFRVLSFVSSAPTERKYSLPGDNHVILGKAFLQLPVTVTNGNPDREDHISLTYVYYIGTACCRKEVMVKWEGT